METGELSQRPGNLVLLKSDNKILLEKFLPESLKMITPITPLAGFNLQSKFPIREEFVAVFRK